MKIMVIVMTVMLTKTTVTIKAIAAMIIRTDKNSTSTNRILLVY